VLHTHVYYLNQTGHPLNTYIKYTFYPKLSTATVMSHESESEVAARASPTACEISTTMYSIKSMSTVPTVTTTSRKHEHWQQVPVGFRNLVLDGPARFYSLLSSKGRSYSFLSRQYFLFHALTPFSLTPFSFPFSRSYSFLSSKRFFAFVFPLCEPKSLHPCYIFTTPRAP
jgi:hypothetical protein